MKIRLIVETGDWRLDLEREPHDLTSGQNPYTAAADALPELYSEAREMLLRLAGGAGEEKT